MEKSILMFTSSAGRIAAMASLAQSALLGWNTTSYWSATNLTGASLLSGYPNCVLSRRHGSAEKALSHRARAR